MLTACRPLLTDACDRCREIASRSGHVVTRGRVAAFAIKLNRDGDAKPDAAFIEDADT